MALASHVLDGSEAGVSSTYRLPSFDARPLALFRIALGVVLLEDLLAQARAIGTFYTDDGIFPRGTTSSPWMWSLLHLSGTAVGVGVLFGVGAVATAAFTMGLFTRVATFGTWLFFVSLEYRAPVIHNGGDRLAAVLLFFGLFTDLSGRYSLDAVRRGSCADVPSLAPRLLQAVPALLYAQTALEKLRDAGPGWFDGSVLYANLHLVGWTRPGGVWLRAHPSLCTALGAATILVELALPVLFLLPSSFGRARAMAVMGHLGLEVGILLTLKVAMFTNVMLAVTPLWLLPSWLDRVGGPLAPAGPRIGPEAARRARGSGVLAAGIFTAIAIAPFLPRTVGQVLHWGGLDLNIGLFAWAYPSMRWEASGVLSDGRTVDPLPPEADFGDGFLNSLWMQLPYRLEDYEPLGLWLCRTHRDGTGSTLRHVRIVKLVRPPYRAGDPLPDEKRRLVLDADCSEARVVEGVHDERVNVASRRSVE